MSRISARNTMAVSAILFQAWKMFGKDVSALEYY